MSYGSGYSRFSLFLSTGAYPVVKMMIIINFAVFFIQVILRNVFHQSLFEWYFGLSDLFWNGMVWQIGTYMFLHGDFWHVLINMLILWMFGKTLEQIWGSRYFLKYYLVCGIGGGIIFLLFSDGVVVGASGAVFGILLAFGLTFPNEMILFSFIFPMKAKYMVLIFGAITFFSIAGPTNDNVAHLAHLGGMIFGFVYLRYRWFLGLLEKMQRPKSDHLILHSYRQSPGPKQEPSPQDEIRKKVDAILDKINAEGYDKLSAEEKKILVDASRKLSERNDERN